jgi:galactose oxidase-like protein
MQRQVLTLLKNFSSKLGDVFRLNWPPKIEHIAGPCTKRGDELLFVTGKPLTALGLRNLLSTLFCPQQLSQAAILVLFLVILVGGAAAQTDPSVVGQWEGPYPWPIVAIHTHVLPNGKVLAWSFGQNIVVWDPAVPGTFTPVPNSRTNVFCGGHSFLPDGRLLVTGGHVSDNVGLKDANIFDPGNIGTNPWSAVANMNAARWYPSNCSLATGEVLVIAGSIDKVQGSNTLPQVWKTTGGWRSLTSAKLNLPLYPWTFVAPNGRVFVAGPNQITRYLNTSGTGSWSQVATSNLSFQRGAGTSVMYDEGKVLIVGGGSPPTATAEVIDLKVTPPVWRVVSPMTYARRHVNATLLPDGKVLVTGGTSLAGNDAAGAVLPAELWDPKTEAWSTMASLPVHPRLYHSTAVLLPDGRVLSAGGGYGNQDVDYYDAEIYSPPYLFAGARPTITSAPASVTYGQTFFVGTPQAATIAKVTWVRLSSVTHSYNQNQRINYLSFTPQLDGVSVTMPANKNLCPPGHYLLFILNGNDVPSVARIIQIR